MGERRRPVSPQLPRVFAFLFTERLFTTISEPGTGYVCNWNVVTLQVHNLSSPIMTIFLQHIFKTEPDYRRIEYRTLGSRSIEVVTWPKGGRGRLIVACERQTFSSSLPLRGVSPSRNVPQRRWARRNVCRSQASLIKVIASWKSNQQFYSPLLIVGTCVYRFLLFQHHLTNLSYMDVIPIVRL